MKSDTNDFRPPNPYSHPTEAIPFETNSDPTTILPPSPYPRPVEVIPFELNFDRDHVLPPSSPKSPSAAAILSPILSIITNKAFNVVPSVRDRTASAEQY